MVSLIAYKCFATKILFCLSNSQILQQPLNLVAKHQNSLYSINPHMYSWKIIHGKHKRIALQSLINHNDTLTSFLTLYSLSPQQSLRRRRPLTNDIEANYHKGRMHQHSHLVTMSNMLDRGLNGTRNCVARRPTNINSTADILFSTLLSVLFSTLTVMRRHIFLNPSCIHYFCVASLLLLMNQDMCGRH